ncbi:MAG TPA: CapA family protein, partial [Thermoguttaceae bacterium]|nr:CapA family protein [Thermoguttaceae bacterium]
MSTSVTSEPLVRFAAVGDLLLTPGPASARYDRDPALVSPRVRELFAQSDLVFGNLECTLAGDGHTVPTEPRVVATDELVRAVGAVGCDVVTLANNHMFDCLEGGFQNLRSLLDESGLPHFGAGMNIEEAEAPAILEINGVRLAFLGAVDRRSGPYRFAAVDQWGVAPLDIDRLTRQIGELRSHVDHVLVSLHWGEERFLIPSPVQIDQAHALVDAGASIVLGHHPHVLQGLELRGPTPIIYSLGNFLADDVH